MPSHIERRSTNQCRTGAVPIAVAALALGLLFAAPASAGKKTDTLGMAYDVFMQMNTLDGAPNPEFKDIRVRKAIALRSIARREAIISYLQAP